MNTLRPEGLKGLEALGAAGPRTYRRAYQPPDGLRSDYEVDSPLVGVHTLPFRRFPSDSDGTAITAIRTPPVLWIPESKIFRRVPTHWGFPQGLQRPPEAQYH